MSEPNLLVFDIETLPGTAVVWRTGKQNVPLSMMLTTGQVLGTGYMWLKDTEAKWTTSIKRAHQLLEKADAIISFNGTSFDEKHLNREFAQAGLKKPSPYQRIDLYRACRKMFTGPSHKLDFYAQQLLGERKMETGGIDLWKGCMQGNQAAMRKMADYCKKDVELTRDLYEYLRDGGWIDSVNMANLNDSPDACPTCGETRVVRIGVAHTKQGEYQRWRCRNFHYFRSVKREAGANTAHIV